MIIFKRILLMLRVTFISTALVIFAICCFKKDFSQWLDGVGSLLIALYIHVYYVYLFGKERTELEKELEKSVNEEEE